MMRKKKGVAIKVKNNIQPLALSTHCPAHSLSLACSDWIRNATAVSKSLDTSYEITNLVTFSPKYDSHLRRNQEEEYYERRENCSS